MSPRPPFCRSCGTIGPTTGSCDRCGTGLEKPEFDGQSIIGLEVETRVGLRRQRGFVLRVAGAKHEILVGEQVVTTSKVEVVSAPQSVSSPAYRLYALSRKATSAAARQLLEDAQAQAMTSLAARRAFASAALAQRDSGAITRSGLSDLECSWLLMWLHHMMADGQGALAYMEALPTEGYPDKVGVIAAWLLAADWSPDRIQRAVRHLKPLARHVPQAALMLCALESHQGPTALGTSAYAVPSIPGVAVDQQALRLALDIAASGGTTYMRDAYRMSAYAAMLRAAQLGKWAEGSKRPDAAELSRMPVPVVDDLIDKQLLDVALDEVSALDPYLRARLAPACLSDAEVDSLEFHFERARRKLIAGEPVEEEDRAPSYLGVLAALSSLRDGDVAPLRSVLGELPEEQRRIADAVIRSFEAGSIDPAAAADRSVWPILSPLLPSGDELSSAPVAIKRLHEWNALESARRALYEWDWTLAADAAKECLRTACDEDVRDEALNLLSCALLLQGNGEGALRALEDALEGVDSPELIINYGIVAADTDRLSASRELGRLAMEAPSLSLRLTAAKRALMLWGSHVPGENSEEDSVPPQELIESMRLLAVEPSSLDEHRSIMSFLSWADSEWLADGRHTAASPHRDTAEHRYLIARASGPNQGVATLAEFLREQPDNSWLQEERENLVESVIGALIDEGRNLGVGIWALEITDSGMALTERQQFLLTVLGVRALAIGWLQLGDEGGTRGPLKHELVERVVSFRTRARRIEDVDAEAAENLINHAIQALAYACLGGWAAELDAIAHAVDEIHSRLSGRLRFQINWSAVEQTAAPLRIALHEIISDMRAVARELSAEPPHDHLAELVDYAERIGGALELLRR